MKKMHTVDIIAKKRDGMILSEKELTFLINAYTAGEIPDYQMAAWLMAVYQKGMTDEETAILTLAMAKSGDMIDLTSIPGIKVDKHSTGGVADTTTLVLAPLVAATGVPVAKMSGRGLGFTGGTIDKLESIPGLNATLTKEEFISNLLKHNLAITGQTADIAPADGKIYALRDVTATIESIPLIASSIMSKKIAAGADKILLDVKVGNGAFMKKMADALKLAETMVRIGELVGRQTIAAITNMDEPLGEAVGNSLEVREAIGILSGRGSHSLKDVCVTLGSYMLVLAGAACSPAVGKKLLRELLDSGKGLNKFREFIKVQGGNDEIVANPLLLPQAGIKLTLVSKHKGFINQINAAQVGFTAMRLGAGREYKEQQIDLAAGIIMHCRVGDYVEIDQPLATIYTNDGNKLENAISMLRQSIVLGSDSVPIPPLIYGIVDINGFHQEPV
ncbi:pyrimidine-nucleoside phosphorylase [Methylomusa anaerophila]|uniref:Pyrimidine-nucleoside phosphorylase n=2 Tax=Methylomusa anaerophila TaxID=1930071 RepID=A0A348APE1_9FIRM|nr:pyrimidine-nucleoside phosphorylase [Methylomusa anaerophila]